MIKNAALVAQQQELMIEACSHPVKFAEMILGHSLWKLQMRILDAITKPSAKVAVKGCHGSSKMLTLDTLIPTPFGWTTMGSIRTGDVVLNENGHATIVIDTSPVMEQPAYRITFDSGDSIVAGEDHLWNVIDGFIDSSHIDWHNVWDETITLNTSALAARPYINGHPRWRIPPAKLPGHIAPHTILSIDPVGTRQARCISVDSPRRLYLAGTRCIPTHNSYTAAEAALWWISHDPEAIAITTAPTDRQVVRVIWAEIQKSLSTAIIKPNFPPPNQKEIRISANNYALGLATNESDRFQGFHGKVLIIVDEATGVQEGLWQAIDGIDAAGDVRILALGNPTIAAGPFYEAFRHPVGWRNFTIDALDTPNLASIPGITAEERLRNLLMMSPDELEQNPVPYLVRRAWVYEKYYKWGPDSHAFQSRVRAQFPAQSPDALYPLGWLERAQWEEGEDDGYSPVTAGLDVAGPGEDETALTVRSGRDIILCQSWSNEDARGDVIAALKPFKDAGRLTAVYADAEGIGHLFVKHLEDLNFPVIPVRFGTSSYDPDDRFSNKKAEIYWNFREKLACTGDEQIRGLTDDVTYSQFSLIRYKHDSHGRIVIESKEQLRKRGVPSPDRMEATIMAFMEEDMYSGMFDGQPPNVHARLIGTGVRDPSNVTTNHVPPLPTPSSTTSDFRLPTSTFEKRGDDFGGDVVTSGTRIFRP